MSSLPSTEDLIQRALAEDLADIGDITAQATIPSGQTGQAVMRSRADGIVSGVDVAAQVFKQIDKNLNVETLLQDGSQVEPGQDILRVSGPAASIVTAERTALNFITHLSGIATITKQYVDAVAGTNARILDTRKTTPGFRQLEKEAVKDGGGDGYRMGLYDAVMIKDNHIAIAGGIGPALDAVKNLETTIEIEVDTLEQLRDVLDHGGADIVLLDNMDPDTLRKGVEMCAGHIKTEASGGVTPDNIRAVAETGVDYISIGALTHSAPALDIGLDIDI